MSRSNTHYWDLCEGSKEQGQCDRHDWNPRRKCKYAAEWECRRGTVKRQLRFPEWSIKSFHKGPPACLKRIWQSKYRTHVIVSLRKAQANQEYDNLALPSFKKFTNLWDWY